MCNEEAILDEAMDNLMEAEQRIRATRNRLWSASMDNHPNYRDLTHRVMTALAMTEAAFVEATSRVATDEGHATTPQDPSRDRARRPPGLVEVLREEGLDAVRYVLWDATGWHRNYSPPAWRHRATAEQKKRGWEMAVRIEKILCAVLDEAHKRQVEETTEETLSERPEEFYRSPLD